MKKIILLLAVTMSISFASAQKANVSKAKNKALAIENPDFAGARELINPALVDPTTKDLPNTWYIAGLIEYKECEAEYEKQMMRKEYDEDKKGQAIMKSYNYFLTADNLGEIPNAKGKVKNSLRKDIKSKIKEYYTTPQHLIGYGAHLYDKNEYAEAYKVFSVFTEIPSLPMMGNEIPIDSTYYMIQYYAALSAKNAGMHYEAIALYESLKTKDYEQMVVYQLLYEEYLAQKDTVNFVQTLKDGFSAFPREAWFLQNLINHYVYSNQATQAMTYLNSAIENEPEIAQYHYVRGVLNEQLGNVDESHVSFDRAIELEPDMADAYAGKGRLIFNSAVKIMDEATSIKDNRKYNAEVEKAENVFKESLPFFIKATELAPEEIEHKRILRTLYYRLQMDAEYEAINNEINAM